MYFHVITTTTCNSKCKYCYEKSCNDFNTPLNKKWKFDFSMPETISYTIKDLKKFFEKSCKKHVITFYGGEPLLEVGKIKEIIDNIEARYMIQTNGILLNSLNEKYLKKFEVILISIDGRKEITDYNKGNGTYDKIIASIAALRKKGFSGELIARMVVTEKTNLPEEVKHLLSIGFDSVHWQIDAGFYSNDYEKTAFKQFSDRYNAQITETVDYWVEEMRKGKVLRIYPFLGIFESLYCHKKERLRCGSGFENYTIAPNGAISVCPIAHDIKEFQVGDIWKSGPDSLDKISIGGFCKNCDILDLCGGRCLYANKAELWPEDGQTMICNTVRHLITSIKIKLPEIRNLIKSGKLREKQFDYEKYTGPEIIP